MDQSSRPPAGGTTAVKAPALLPLLIGPVGLVLMAAAFVPGLPVRGLFFFAGLSCVVGAGIGYLILEEYKRRRLDRESFRRTLIHELRTQGGGAFTFSGLVERAGVARRAADQVAEELYGRLVRDCVRDGMITAAEAGKLDQLASLLELSVTARSRIDTQVKQRRYSEHFQWMLADGVLTDDEAAQLASLRANLGLTPEAVREVTALTGADAYRAFFRQIIRKGRIAETDLKELAERREASGLTPTAAQALVRDDALDFYRERFFAAKQDGHISPEEENELVWLQTFLGLSDNDTIWFRQEIERIKYLEQVRSGSLPQQPTQKLLEGGEICHWESPCRYCWSTATQEKSTDGEVLLTSQRVIFTSGLKSFEFKPARIVDIRCYSDGVGAVARAKHKRAVERADLIGGTRSKVLRCRR